MKKSTSRENHDSRPWLISAQKKWSCNTDGQRNKKRDRYKKEQARESFKRDRLIRPKPDDRINKNHTTKYFLPYDQINRKPNDQIYLPLVTIL